MIPDAKKKAPYRGVCAVISLKLDFEMRQIVFENDICELAYCCMRHRDWDVPGLFVPRRMEPNTASCFSPLEQIRPCSPLLLLISLRC